LKDAQKPDHVNLNALINRLKEGRFVIPDFQREFEWEPWDVRELIRSIFLDYYIGSLLLWRGKEENFDALSCEDVYGFTGEARKELIVLDGQQRLTAMYYAFAAPDVLFPKRTFRAFFYIRIDRFMNEDYDQAFHYDWFTIRWSKILDNDEAQYADHIFPLFVIGKGGWELPNWVQGYIRYWKEKTEEAEAAGDLAAAEMARNHTENAESFGELVKGITEEYQVSYIELDKDLAIDKVCDIFTQINSRGHRLDVFDLINALLKPKGLQLKHMWRDAASRLEFVDTDRMNVYLLQMMSILRQAYCSPKYLYFLLPGQEKPVRDPDGTRRREVLIADTEDFEKRWNEAVDAIEGAIKLLRHPQEFGAISSSYLPYVSILPVFSALQAHKKQLPANTQLDAQRKISHWYWASVFNNRYSGSVESTSARDFLDVKKWLEDDDSEPSLIMEFKASFRNLDLRSQNSRSTSVYKGIFNLLVIKGAKDWMTGNAPQHDDLDDHHIVPLSWGKENLSDGQVNTILNRTPLSAVTNRSVINDRLPNEYLPALIEANGEQAVRAIMESHFISPAAQAILLRDPFTPDDYDDFISERQRTLQEAIESLLVKERLDLSPQIRELDERIETLELSLRGVVAAGLNGSATELPPHVIGNVNERIRKRAAKDAAMDTERYQTIEGKLEMMDMRELQDTILSKPLWPLFESRFANKETLNGRFGQLSELRNGIRHSRSVDEVTRKDGEASILWFEQVLRNDRS